MSVGILLALLLHLLWQYLLSIQKPIKMAKKKSITKKSIPQKTTMIKIAEKVGEIAGRIVNEKDHLVEMAGGAIDSVKTAVKNITSSKKKATVKKAAKKAVKKIAEKIEKKVVRPAAKKVKKVASSKKAAAVKKVIKKAVKKVAKKGSSKKK